jgi:EmrB/QacA subfamily drug resistance transporter
MAVAFLVAATWFMEHLDGTAIVPAVPQMASAFAVRPVDLNIGISAYLLTLAVFIPASGWAAVRFGTRRIFALAIAIFTLASLLCSLAANLPMFVAARILQGAGGAMMVPVGRLAVLRLVPKHKLIHAIAALTWPALVAPVLGPPLGGFICDHLGWRWIFYLNLPLGVIALVIAARLMPSGKSDSPPPLDWTGFALTGSALFALLYAAEILGRSGNAAEITGFALAGVVLAIAAAWHLSRAAHPLLTATALSVPGFRVSFWGGSFFRLGIAAVPFLVPLMYQIGYGFSATHAGLMLMAVFAGNLLMKPWTTPILRRFGFRPVLIVNGLINVAAIAACALISETLPLAAACAILFASGLVRSMQFTTLNTIAFADVPPGILSGANTLSAAVEQLASGLGIAVGAFAWHIGTALAPSLGAAPALPFRIAFVVVALFPLLALFSYLRLPPRAGDHLARKNAR